MSNRMPNGAKSGSALSPGSEIVVSSCIGCPNRDQAWPRGLIGAQNGDNMESTVFHLENVD
jgi:hypothetical protein